MRNGHTIKEVASSLYKEGGIRRFYRGFVRLGQDALLGDASRIRHRTLRVFMEQAGGRVLGRCGVLNESSEFLRSKLKTLLVQVL